MTNKVCKDCGSELFNIEESAKYDYIICTKCHLTLQKILKSKKKQLTFLSPPTAKRIK